MPTPSRLTTALETPAVRTASGTNTRMTDWPLGPSTGRSTSFPPAVAAVNACPGPREHDGRRDLGRRAHDAPVRQEHRGGADPRGVRVGHDLVDAPVVCSRHDGDALRVLPGGVEGPVGDERAHEDDERQQERHHHRERGRGAVEHDPAPHASGSTSRSPTPRTLSR